MPHLITAQPHFQKNILNQLIRQAPIPKEMKSIGIDPLPVMVEQNPKSLLIAFSHADQEFGLVG